MPLTSKDSILGLKDISAPLEFAVPEWNDTVYLRWPTANTRDEWEVYCRENATKPKSIWRAKLASLLLCDKDGGLLFRSADEVERLGEKSAAALHRIWERGVRMLTITESEVEELEKN
jgi:hypothetical protein